MAAKLASPANALNSCQALSIIRKAEKKDARKNGNNFVKSPTRHG